MSRKKIMPALLIALLLLLPACATAECPTFTSVPPPASRAESGKTVSSGLPEKARPALRKSLPPGQSAASRILTSSSGAVSILRPSQPPTAAPAKPMPPVTAKMPAASGTKVFSRQNAAVDYSNASQGYVMVRYSGTAKIKVLIYFNGSSSFYPYDLAGNGAYVALPLQSGSGSYRIRFMKNVSGNSYAELCSTAITTAVSGFGCYLYPNQYVNYSRSSAAVTKAKSLCAKCSSNAEKVAAVNRFITTAVKYDYGKAKSVQAGYLPNVDSTLASGRGICFDYSALMAAMCRSQGIPTRLVVGNASVGYHAWNEVYLGGWKRYDTTFAAARQSVKSYTAEKYY